MLPLINTEKIYRSDFKTDGYWYYLKFYKDSSVISVSSSGRPKHLKEWFNKSHEQVSIGKYRIKSDSIFFSSTNHNGTVNYKGIIAAKKIFLHSNSDINGHKEYRIFKLKK